LGGAKVREEWAEPKRQNSGIFTAKNKKSGAFRGETARDFGIKRF
jgi:hypothetical protein